MFSSYREVRCPLLLVNAVAPENLGSPTAAGPRWIAELASAFLRGQTHDLVAIAAAQPNVRFETVTGTHGLLFERPQDIANLVLAFLTS